MRNAAIAALLVLLAACDYDPQGRCEVSAECPRGQLCSGGVCTVPPPAPPNDAPVAVEDAYAVVAGQSFECPAALGLLANDWDPDDDALAAERVGSARTANGWAYVEPTGAFRYLPDDGYSGVDAFTYRASDGALPSAVTTVTLTVTAAP